MDLYDVEAGILWFTSSRMFKGLKRN